MKARVDPGAKPADKPTEMAARRRVPRGAAVGVCVAVIAAGLLWVLIVWLYLSFGR